MVQMTQVQFFLSSGSDQNFNMSLSYVIDSADRRCIRPDFNKGSLFFSSTLKWNFFLSVLLF